MRKNLIDKKQLIFYGGTGLAQLLSIATSLLILAKYSAESFGIFSYYLAVASIIGSISTLKFELAIPLSRSKVISQRLVYLTIYVSVFSILVIALSAVLLGMFNNYKLYALCFSIGLLISLNAVFNQYFLFLEKFVLSGIIPILLSGVNLVLLALINDDNGISILLAYVIASFVVLLVYFISYFKESNQISNNWSTLREYWFRYIDYPKFIWPASIIGILSSYVNPILVENLFGFEQTGLYSIAFRILMLPIIVFGSVSSSIYRVKLSKAHHNCSKEDIWLLTRSMLLLNCIVVLIAFPLCLFAAKFAISMFDLKEWLGVVAIMKRLLPFSIGLLFFQLMVNVYLILDKNKNYFWANSFQFSVILLAYVLAKVFALSFSSYLLLVGLLGFVVLTAVCIPIIIKVKSFEV